MRVNKTALLIGALVIMASQVQAQYFGRNKASYEQFDHEVYRTPHFDIYHYLDNQEALDTYAQWAERWYAMHQRVLGDTIYSRNPIILYNDHPDFQQTNTISGNIGVGTGGVTEAFKNRVVLPFAMSNQQSFHVLGHEMVHAFQYNMIINGDSTSLRSLSNLPLWMVEGLAEYMSIGSLDAHTAMWMRDAVMNDEVPTIKDLQNPKYFPYRYGQAFWSFVTGLKGDDIITPYFRATAKFGLEIATQQMLGMTLDNLSELWVNSVKRQYGPYIAGKKENFIGQEIVGDENSGRINISPAISPNGRYVIFLSEKDLFSIDLFLADVREKKIIRKVASATRSGHIDDFSYIESAGAWSPDSRQFAFVGFSQGKNLLIVKDVESGRTVQESFLDGVPAFSNPSWSPDGRTIVVAGLVEGQIDLYSFDLRTRKVAQITDNHYSELLPHWMPDGRRIVFSTDEVSMRQGRTNGHWTFNLAILDVESGQTEHLDVFPGANNLNPVSDPDGNILFLSNRDGFRNIYEYAPGSGKVYQVTDYLTGVSGITHYAPAISMAVRRERLMYTRYANNRYEAYLARPEDYIMEEVDPYDVEFSAAMLPRPLPEEVSNLVDLQLDRLDQTPPPVTPAQFEQVPYKPNFKLDYIGGSAGVGIGTSNTFGTTTGVAGGVDLLFSDILGNSSIYTSLALNGEIYDFGGTAAYINRKSRIKWGGALSHIPFRTTRGGFAGIDSVFVDDNQYLLAEHYIFDIQRTFEDKASVFAFYPFNTTLRLEAEASFARYSTRVDRFDNYYDAFGQLIIQERERLDAQPGFNLINIGGALVRDNSYFGLTAPLQGSRLRLGVDQYWGEFRFTAPTIDYRVYRFLRPVALAFRATHYGRYGQRSDQGLFPLYLGSPWYMRGYNGNAAQEILVNNDLSIDNLYGSKVAVANFEVRIPFTGPEQLAMIKSGFLFSDLNFFVDGGVSWYDFEQFNDNISNIDGTRFDRAKPIFSAGVSLRVNLFGAMVLEPYYAFPIQKETKGVFGLNIFPGW